jgi:hypothetical protein
MYLKVSLSVSTEYLHRWELENLTLLCMLAGAPKPIEERKEEIMRTDGLQAAVAGCVHACRAE